MSGAIARRNRGCCAARGNGRMTRFGIVGPVAADDIEQLIVARDLVEQLSQDVTVGNVLTCHQRGANLTSVRVEREMHLAPRATFRVTMLAHFPFTFALESVSKRVVWALKRSPADQATGEFEELLMDVGTTLKSCTKTAESVQPGIGAFDDPTYFPRTAAVRFTASGNRCGNPGSVQRPAIFVVVVSPIGIDPARLAQGATTQTANRWDGVDQWQQLRDVVAVRARQDDRERRTVGVGGDVMFGTGSRTIGSWTSSGCARRHSFV